MKNGAGNDTSKLEAEVCHTVEQGEDVQERVRKLTLDIIGTRSLDIKSVRQTADAVLRGAKAGVQKELERSSAQTGLARERLKQAVSGLDVALAQFAEAAKLSVEEAASKAKNYSGEDLKRAREDLSRLDDMFVDTLKSSASAATGVAGEILHDLAVHARTHGSAVGRQMKETVSVLVHHIGAAGRAQTSAGLHLAMNTSNMVRKIAAGVLSGLADHVSPGKEKGE